MSDIPKHISDSDLTAIGAMLRQADCFGCPPLPEVDRYDALDIVTASILFHVEFWLVLDRNVLSCVTSLIAPVKHPIGQQERRAAAIMAFAIAAEIQFDATLAVAEVTQPAGAARGQADALLLVGLQNLPARAFVDIALGHADCLNPQDLAKATSDAAREGAANLPVDLWEWCRPVYGAALKLATIRLLGPPNAMEPAQFAEFLRSSYEEYLFVPSAIMYGCLAFGRSRRGDMFKKLRSGDPSIALAGVRNAAWDMALLHYCERRNHEDRVNNHCSMLCSFDRAVQDCATYWAIPDHQPAVALAGLRARWRSEWGERAGDELFEQYAGYRLRQEADTRRPAHQYKHQRAHWDAVIDQLEQSFLEAVR